MYTSCTIFSFAWPIIWIAISSGTFASQSMYTYSWRNWCAQTLAFQSVWWYLYFFPFLLRLQVRCMGVVYPFFRHHADLCRVCQDCVTDFEPKPIIYVSGGRCQYELSVGSNIFSNGIFLTPASALVWVITDGLHITSCRPDGEVQHWYPSMDNPVRSPTARDFLTQFWVFINWSVGVDSTCATQIQLFKGEQAILSPSWSDLLDQWGPYTVNKFEPHCKLLLKYKKALTDQSRSVSFFMNNKNNYAWEA